MSVTFEANGRLYLGAAARLISDVDRELAWAERLVRKDPDIKWILGNYVQADVPNDNGHVFPLAELEGGLPTLQNAPLNMMHRAHHTVGTFAANEMVYPVSGSESPHAEALAAFWSFYFHDELHDVQEAHEQGSLFYSMECVPRAFACPLEGCEGQEFAYAGRTSPTYCQHLNEHASIKHLMGPHFTGGALILPPSQPAWKQADITQLATLIERNLVEAELTEATIAKDFAHLDAREWEGLMTQVLLHAQVCAEQSMTHAYTSTQRRVLAGKGHALADGSYCIVTVEDLKDALQTTGSGFNVADDIKRHIATRANALDSQHLLPASW